MSKKTRMLNLMTAVFLLFVLLLCLHQAKQTQIKPVSFQVISDNGLQNIELWDDGEGKSYVFLPSYARMHQVQAIMHTGNPVSINGVRLENGMNCDSFALETPYVFSYTSWGKEQQKEITFLRSAHIAAMCIDTQSGSTEYIHEQKGNKESGKMTLYLPDGTIGYAGTLESIQGRGNFTWTEFEKKPYSLKLSAEADLLGLGSAEKWILLANADDFSSMRNKVLYDFADRVGLEYSPDSDWVDLYLNGEYVGLYLLCERNEVHSERVDIAETGSFLVSLERHDRIAAQNYAFVATDADQYLRIHYPQTLTAEQQQELENTWQSVENAILAENDMDPITGKSWMEQIDLDSWVKKYLMEEIFGNGDACYISQFFYCDSRDGENIIFAGPVWDYDHTMGSESAWALIDPNTLYANRYYVKDGFNTPWFHALYQKDIFYDRMIEIYQNDFLPLLNNFLNEHIDACSQWIAQAYSLNQIRWVSGGKDVHETSEYLQQFMKDRVAFLNSIWIEEMPYYTVKADHGWGGFYGYYAVFPGEFLNDLPVFEDTETSAFVGWYYADSHEPFDGDRPITEDMDIYAKWQNKPARWIGRVEKILPLLVMLALLVILFVVDWRKTKRTYGRK